MFRTAAIITIIFLTAALGSIQRPAPQSHAAATSAAQTTRCPFAPPTCAAHEAAILSATVRMHIISTAKIPTEALEAETATGLSGNGHGTVLDGRYVVTHNHFSALPLTALAGDIADLIIITLYDANGRVLLYARGDYVSVVQVDGETVVLDFGVTGEGIGRLAAAGSQSATLHPDAERHDWTGHYVAQVDWDGTRSHVNWAVVEGHDERNGTPIVVLDSPIRLGASGGGIFIDGQHIANNMSRLELCSVDDVCHAVGSTGALNSQMLGGE